jgi:hypothetical protein
VAVTKLKSRETIGWFISLLSSIVFCERQTPSVWMRTSLNSSGHTFEMRGDTQYVVLDIGVALELETVRKTSDSPILWHRCR